jgi:lysophospholipase L1-like esterase
MRNMKFSMRLAFPVCLVLALAQSLSMAAPKPGDADYPAASPSARHTEKVAAVKSGNYDLVLIGDSITHTIGELGGKYEPLKAVWEKHFAPRRAINLGHNGYRTENILWNLLNGELDFPRSPKVAMILIGTNNSDDRHFARVHTPEEILAGTKAIVELIRRRHPTTKILVLRIFPRGGDSEKAVSLPAFNSSAKCIETCRRAGQLTAQLADGRQVFWLDVNHVFLRPDGTINTDLMWDLLHPGPAGTEAWAQAVEPTLAQLMGDKPIVDPPPNPRGWPAETNAPVEITSQEKDWSPSRVTTLNGKPIDDLTINGRPYEVFQHGVKPEWGYKAPQQDAFILIHPKNERKNAPLYVVLHSAGHDVLSCVKCTRDVGNHDLYRSPDDFYALYLDCRRNPGDWWWGGMHLNDPNLTKKNSGGDPTPVERRVMDTVKWVIMNYDIDPNRVYLCGISMGGSGTLGIGMRNGDVFAAIKAGVPAGIEHVSHRLYFPPAAVPENFRLPDPPIAIDYSAQNDGWSAGHERFAKAMNDCKYALLLYWGPFGHAHNHAAIEKVNDLVNSFDWLKVKKNEAYPVFANATSNNKLPWPGDLRSNAAGQVNAFFRWKCLQDAKDRLEMLLFLVAPAELKTTFQIPKESTADVSLRRIQKSAFAPGDPFQWTFGTAKGEGRADTMGVITIPGLKITAQPATLAVSKRPTRQ